MAAHATATTMADRMAALTRMRDGVAERTGIRHISAAAKWFGRA